MDDSSPSHKKPTTRTLETKDASATETSSSTTSSEASLVTLVENKTEQEKFTSNISPENAMESSSSTSSSYASLATLVENKNAKKEQGKTTSVTLPENESYETATSSDYKIDNYGRKEVAMETLKAENYAPMEISSPTSSSYASFVTLIENKNAKKEQEKFTSVVLPESESSKMLIFNEQDPNLINYSSSSSVEDSSSTSSMLIKEAATTTNENESEITLYMLSDVSFLADEPASYPGGSVKETATTKKVEDIPKKAAPFEITNSDESLEEVKERTIRFSLDSSDTEPLPKKITYGGEKFAAVQPSKSQHKRSHDDDYSDDDEIATLPSGHVFVYMIIPPDGGYGWLISFISFLSQVVIDGIILSIGVVLPKIAEEFGSKAILIASIQIVYFLGVYLIFNLAGIFIIRHQSLGINLLPLGCRFYFLSGAASSAFINKFGFRPVALMGSLLSITALTIATFSVNLPMMIIFYSVLGGPGLSMVWVSSQLIIGYYFDKFRPIANGASCSGAGIGIMIFCYMNSVLLPVLGWRNVMRVHVGFLVLVLLMTLTYVEVAPTRIGRVKETYAEESDSESLDLFTGLTEYSRYSIKMYDQEYALDENFHNMIETSRVKKKRSTLDACLQICCPCVLRCLERRRKQKAAEEDSKGFVIRTELIDKQDLFYSGPKSYIVEQQTKQDLAQIRSMDVVPSIQMGSSQRRIISLDDIDNKYRKHTIISTLSSMKMVRAEEEKRYLKSYAELKLISKSPLLAFLSPRNWIHPKIQKAFQLLFDFRLLSLIEFRILLLSAFLFPLGFNIPFVYSTVRVQIDPSYAKLITPTIGFSNFVFRIASGFIAFKFREYTTYICGGGMFIGGFAVFVSAFYGLDVIWFQFLYAFCYGMAPAFYSSLRAIIYVRTLGLDKLTNAFGLTALAMGLGVFMGTTAAGIMNDLTGSYTLSFAFAGMCICASSALKLMLPYIIKISKAKEEK